MSSTSRMLDCTELPLDFPLRKYELSTRRSSLPWCARCMQPMVWGSRAFRLDGCSRWSLLTHVCIPAAHRTPSFYLTPGSLIALELKKVLRGVYRSSDFKPLFSVRSRLWFKAWTLRVKSLPSRWMDMLRRFGSTKSITYREERSSQTLAGYVRIYTFASWRSS